MMYDARVLVFRLCGNAVVFCSKGNRRQERLIYCDLGLIEVSAVVVRDIVGDAELMQRVAAIIVAGPGR